MSENVLNWRNMHKDATTTLEGAFSVIIVEANATKTNDGTKDMIKWKAKVETGPYAGRPLWGNFTISPESPSAMRILFSHLAVLGLDEKFWNAHPEAPVSLIAQSIIGRKAVAEVGVRQWNGTDREEVKAWRPALGGPGGNVPLGVLGGFGGTPSSSSGIPGVPASIPSTPATHPSVPAVADDSPVAFRQGPVPVLRHDTTPEPGAVATEPATAPTSAPPALPF